jgi:hypothetical protein
MLLLPLLLPYVLFFALAMPMPGWRSLLAYALIGGTPVVWMLVNVDLGNEIEHDDAFGPVLAVLTYLIGIGVGLGVGAGVLTRGMLLAICPWKPTAPLRILITLIGLIVGPAIIGGYFAL